MAQCSWVYRWHAIALHSPPAQTECLQLCSRQIHIVDGATVLDIGQMRLTLWGFQFARSLRPNGACVRVCLCAMASVHLDSERTADTTANDTAFGNNLFADFIHFMDTKWMFFMCVIHFIDLFSFASFSTPFCDGFCVSLSPAVHMRVSHLVGC